MSRKAIRKSLLPMEAETLEALRKHVALGEAPDATDNDSNYEEEYYSDEEEGEESDDGSYSSEEEDYDDDDDEDSESD